MLDRIPRKEGTDDIFLLCDLEATCTGHTGDKGLVKNPWISPRKPDM